jgi:hypothetical protein
MAKFSDTFIQGLLNPSYSKRLGDAAEGIGQAPALMLQQQQRQQREKGMMGGMLAAQQAAAEGRFDTETMKSYIGSMRGLGVSSADIMETLPDLKETSKTAAKENALAELQTSITELMNPETTPERASEIRASALSQGRAARVDEARLRDALDGADRRRVGSFLETQTRIINELNIKAKQAISRGQSKEDFVAANGEQYGYIYDDEVTTQELRAEQVRKAKENKNLDTFAYTDQELKKLGLTDAQINNVKNLKVGGRGKNNAVFNYVTANEKTAPNASLINVYAKAFEAEIAETNDLDFDDTDDYREIQSLAAKKALEVFATQGLEGIAKATVENQRDEDSNEIDVGAFMKTIMAELGQAD